MRRGESIYKRKDGRWEGRYAKQRMSDNKIVYASVYGKKYAEVKEKLERLKESERQTKYLPHPTYPHHYQEYVTTIFLPQIQAVLRQLFGKMIQLRWM